MDSSHYFQIGAAIAERNRARDEQREQMGELSARNKAMRTVLPYLAQQAGISAEMLDPFLDGSPDESPRAEAAKFDTLLKSIVQAGELRRKQQDISEAEARIYAAGQANAGLPGRIAAGDEGARLANERARLANEGARLAKEGLPGRRAAGGEPARRAPGGAAVRNRQAATGADAHEDFNRNLQAMLRYDSYGAGAPLRPEIAAEAARLAGGTGGRMARLGARITPEMLAGFEKDDAANAAMGRVGTAFTAPDGSQYLWQNRGQVVPLSRGGAGSGAPRVVSDPESGVQFYDAGGGKFRPLPTARTSAIDPVKATRLAEERDYIERDLVTLRAESPWTEKGKAEKALKIKQASRRLDEIDQLLRGSGPASGAAPAGEAAPAGGTPTGAAFAGKHLAGRTVHGTDGKLYRVDAEGHAHLWK
jgi:hypothetical protein